MLNKNEHEPWVLDKYWGKDNNINRFLTSNWRKDKNITEPWVLDKYWGKDNNISEPWVLDKYWGKDNNISHANIAMGVSEAYIK